MCDSTSSSHSICSSSSSSSSSSCNSSSSSYIRRHSKSKHHKRKHHSCESFENLKVKHNVKIGGTIKLPTTFNITVPSCKYPTIQSAINHFSGRHGMHGTITVLPGTYIESLMITKMCSNRDNFCNRGFKIIGDARGIMGTVFLHNGIHSNALSIAGFGTDFASVTLSNVTSTITVVTTGSPINFSMAGLVIGDKIKIRDNSGTWVNATVNGVLGNTITHDAGNVLVGGIGSALVLCPNVELCGKNYDKPTINVEGASLRLCGLWLNTDTKKGAVAGIRDNLFVYSSANVQVENCVFDNVTKNLNNSNVTVYDNASLIFSRSNDVAFGASAGIQMPVTVIGDGLLTGTGLLVTDSSSLIGGCQSVFDAATFSSQSSELSSIIGQYVGGAGNIIPYGIAATDNSIILTGYLRVFYCDAASNVEPIGIVVERNSTATLTVEGSTSIVDCNNIVGSRGIFGNNGNIILYATPITIQNVSVGVSLRSVSTLSSRLPTAVPIYINLRNDDVVTDTLSIYDQSSAVATPGNIFTYFATPPFGLENEFTNQLIAALSAIYIPLDPSLTLNGIEVYRGKTFTITANTNPLTKHTITLVGGSIFKGFGFNGTTKAIFIAEDSFITILVESLSIARIISYYGMSFI